MEQVWSITSAKIPRNGKIGLLTDMSTNEEKIKVFINWYSYKNHVWQLQAEGYKGATTNKLQGAQYDQLKQVKSMSSKFQGYLI